MVFDFGIFYQFDECFYCYFFDVVLGRKGKKLIINWFYVDLGCVLYCEVCDCLCYVLVVSVYLCLCKVYRFLFRGKFVDFFWMMWCKSGVFDYKQ